MCLGHHRWERSPHDREKRPQDLTVEKEAHTIKKEDLTVEKEAHIDHRTSRKLIRLRKKTLQSRKKFVLIIGHPGSYDRERRPCSREGSSYNPGSRPRTIQREDLQFWCKSTGCLDPVTAPISIFQTVMLAKLQHLTCWRLVFLWARDINIEGHSLSTKLFVKFYDLSELSELSESLVWYSWLIECASFILSQNYNLNMHMGVIK